MTGKSENGDIEHLSKLVKDVQFAMFTTHDANDGQRFRSRPMTLQETEFNGDFWFFVGKSASAVEDVQKNPHVNLNFAQPQGQEYISVYGVGEVVFDQAKIRELWKPALKAWFPKGVDDPEIALLRVHVESADYWEAPSSKIVQLIGFTKAILTGKPLDQNDIGTRGHVEVSRSKH